jgi:opacity protein-like surface antigen
MKLRTTFVALGALAAASGPAGAENLAWAAGLNDVAAPAQAPAALETAGNVRWGAGLKDLAVPAPIPVPGAFPVREGFSYYLRADLSWGWGENRAYTERGAIYGELDSATGPFNSTAIPFTSQRDDVFGGTIGVGAYFTQRIRGDITLDFHQNNKYLFNGTYAYPVIAPVGQAINGRVTDTIKLSNTVALVNAYFDILPRGMFTPYVGAGIGVVYNQMDRNYLNTETQVNGAGAVVGGPFVRVGTGREDAVGLAAALMAGASISFDHRWALDIGYRALYMDGTSATATIPSFFAGQPAQQTTAALGDVWEHQIRVGLRWNLW